MVISFHYWPSQEQKTVCDKFYLLRLDTALLQVQVMQRV